MTYESARDFINMITCELKYEKLIIDLLSLKTKGKANTKRLIRYVLIPEYCRAYLF